MSKKMVFQNTDKLFYVAVYNDNGDFSKLSDKGYETLGLANASVGIPEMTPSGELVQDEEVVQSADEVRAENTPAPEADVVTTDTAPVVDAPAEVTSPVDATTITEDVTAPQDPTMPAEEVTPPSEETTAPVAPEATQTEVDTTTAPVTE